MDSLLRMEGFNLAPAVRDGSLATADIRSDRDGRRRRRLVELPAYAERGLLVVQGEHERETQEYGVSMFHQLHCLTILWVFSSWPAISAADR